MNIGHDHHQDDALTPEERALADRLSRGAPRGEPSAALDARILAAAREAAAAPAAPARTSARRHAPQRWPLAMGVAATLALAVGIAWQLRPGQDAAMVYSTDTAATPAATEEQSAAADKAVAQPMQAETVDHAPPSQSRTTEQAKPIAAAGTSETADAAAGTAPGSTSAAAKRAATADRPAPPPEPSPIVFDQVAPMDTPAPAPMPAPPAIVAPAAAPAASAWPGTDKAKAPPSAEPRPDTAIGTAAATQSKQVEYKQAPPQPLPARERDKSQGTAASGVANQPATPRVQTHKQVDAESRSLDRIEVTGSRIERFGDQPIDDQPPASADSPQVRDAWLQRIRDLVSAGKLDAARDSLREYQRRYPRATLPDDLRALLAE